LESFQVIRKMPQYFAFLRAVNAGTGRVVRMNALREAFESLGFLRVATFLGSGNVVFETRARDLGTLERKSNADSKQALGYEVRVFLRTHAELKEIGAFEPFENTVVQGADLDIIFLAHDLDEGPKAKLVAPRTRMDGFRATDVKFTGGVARGQAGRFSRRYHWRRCSACSAARTPLESWSRFRKIGDCCREFPKNARFSGKFSRTGVIHAGFKSFRRNENVGPSANLD